jgi:pyroglutamyl-peptidase
MPRNVLITGYGPFPGAPFNPSALLAQRLARRRRPAFADLAFNVHSFATSYAAVDRDLAALLVRRPDIVLMFGLAGRTRHVRIETRARNARSVIFPDADRARPTAGAIAHGGPPALTGSAAFHRLLQAARATGVPARLSRDAGRYLCNYAYWRALEATARGKTRVQFVHIPPTRRHPVPMARTKRRCLSLDDLVRAAEAILTALVAAHR